MKIDTYQLSQEQSHPLQLTLPLPLTQHPAEVYLQQLRPRSQATMRRCLNIIANTLTSNTCDALSLDWGKLRYQHTAAVRMVLAEKFAPSTVNQMLCALRRVLKEAKKLKLISAIDYSEEIDLESFPENSELKGRALENSEISALMKVCREDKSRTGVRDLALIGILLGSGLRRSEVVNLELQDFDPVTGALRVIGGKRGKNRTVYLPTSAKELVQKWLKVRGVKNGPLLYPISRGKRVGRVIN